MQHHDAMTGTHKEAVGKDYVKMMKQRQSVAFDESGVLA